MEHFPQHEPCSNAVFAASTGLFLACEAPRLIQTAQEVGEMVRRRQRGPREESSTGVVTSDTGMPAPQLECFGFKALCCHQPETEHHRGEILLQFPVQVGEVSSKTLVLCQARPRCPLWQRAVPGPSWQGQLIHDPSAITLGPTAR